MRKIRKIAALFMVLVLFAGVIVPSTQVDAATVSVKNLYTKKTANYTKLPKNYLYVNNKKIDMTNIPIFMSSGAYVGSVAKIFKNSTLNVKLEDSKVNGKGVLKLTYGKKVLTITENTKTAKLNGVTTTLAAAPFRAYYNAKKVTRWVVPLWSVCSRLGISYQRTSDGVIRIGGTTNNNTGGTEPNNNTSKTVVLCLDAGHGGSDSGATGNGLKEKNLTLAIVLAAKKYFDADSRFKVYYTRTSDTYPTLSARYNMANTKSSDLFVSVHINSFTATSQGSETLYNPNRLTATEKNSITSKELATTMQKYMVSATGFRNRGLVSRTDLAVLNGTKMPACLLEFGFITNKTEALSMKSGTTRYGKAVYDGIVNLCKTKKLIN